MKSYIFIADSDGDWEGGILAFGVLQVIMKCPEQSCAALQNPLWLLSKAPFVRTLASFGTLPYLPYLCQELPCISRDYGTLHCTIARKPGILVKVGKLILTYKLLLQRQLVAVVYTDI
jgi:hypothetical protein